MPVGLHSYLSIKLDSEHKSALGGISLCGERLIVYLFVIKGRFAHQTRHTRRDCFTEGGDHRSLACESTVTTHDTRQVVHNLIKSRPGCFASVAVEVDSTVHHCFRTVRWPLPFHELRRTRSRSRDNAVFVIYTFLFLITKMTRSPRSHQFSGTDHLLALTTC